MVVEYRREGLDELDIIQNTSLILEIKINGNMGRVWVNLSRVDCCSGNP